VIFYLLTLAYNKKEKTTSAPRGLEELRMLGDSLSFCLRMKTDSVPDTLCYLFNFKTKKGGKRPKLE
jgi:hypothetical protein